MTTVTVTMRTAGMTGDGINIKFRKEKGCISFDTALFNLLGARITGEWPCPE